MKKIWMIVFFLLLIGTISKSAYAKESSEEKIEEEIEKQMEEQMELYTEEIDYTQIQAVMEELLQDTSFDFKEAVKSVMEGDNKITLQNLLDNAWDMIRQAFFIEKNTIAKILVFTAASGIFVNFSNVFKSSQVAEVGFFVTYLLLFSAISTSFYSISKTTTSALEGLLEFMKVLLPSYFVAVTFATGSSVSYVFYEMAMILILAAEYVIVKCVLPMVHIYFVVSLVNYISKEDYLSKTTKLLETLIQWLVRTILGVTVGCNVIQGMIVPVAGYTKQSVLLKAARMLPGIGNALGSVAESIVGAGILVKNAIGTIGITAIVCIMAVPVIKIGSYCMLYKISTAVIQPISDKRIMECMEGAGKGADLFLYLTVSGAAMFLLTIAIVMASTNYLPA